METTKIIDEMIKLIDSIADSIKKAAFSLHGAGSTNVLKHPETNADKDIVSGIHEEPADYSVNKSKA